MLNSKLDVSSEPYLGFSGRLSGLLGIVLFWLGLIVAALMRRPEYDWRYMPLSDLLSPSRNPAGFGYALAGVGLGGLSVFLWTRRAAAGRLPGLRVLQAGLIGLLLCLLPAKGLFGWKKAHELFALIAMAGLTLGVLRLFYRGLQIRLTASVRRPVWAAGLIAAAASPLVLAVLAQAYVFYALPHLPWVSLAWRTRGVPVVLSFAFWEWLSAGFISGALVVVIAAAPLRRPV